MVNTYHHTTYQGTWKSLGKIGKKCDFVSEKCVIFARKCKKIQFWPKCAQKMDFGQIVRYRAIFTQKCGITYSHFSERPDLYIIINFIFVFNFSISLSLLSPCHTCNASNNVDILPGPTRQQYDCLIYTYCKKIMLWEKTKNANLR